MDLPPENEATTTTDKESKSKKDEEDDIPKPRFKCENCEFQEEYDHFGIQPPFANKIKFNEKCYVMKDPFSPAPEHAKTTNSEYFIALGANCAQCDRMICRGQDCSFYYLKTYCLRCAGGIVNKFPLEVQSKIRKNIANSRST